MAVITVINKHMNRSISIFFLPWEYERAYIHKDDFEIIIIRRKWKRNLRMVCNGKW
jgi:hypothetical protein